MLAWLTAFRALDPIVRPIVVELVKQIGGARDSRGMAARLLNEARRLRDFDEQMGRRS